MIVLFSLLVFVLFVALRLLPGPYAHQAGGRDEDFHRYLIREYVEHGHRLPKISTRVLGGRADHDYPSFYHWLLSYIPARGLFVVRRLSGLLFDVVVGVLIGSLLVCFANLPLGEAIAISALYVVLPSFTVITMGPRSYNLTPRNFSQTTTGIAVLLIVASFGDAAMNWGAVTVAGGFLSLSLISSKFSVQYVILVLAPASLATVNYPACLSIATSVVLAALFWRNFFRQIKGQWLHLEWYYKHGWHFVSHRGNWRRLWDAISLRTRWIVLEEVLFFNPLTSGIVRHLPVFVSLLTLLAVAVGSSYNFPIALLVATAVVWLLTSFGRFRILGEAERYLEQSVAPAWYLLWSVMPSAAQFPMIVFLCCTASSSSSLI